jgi:hypothetical protein
MGEDLMDKERIRQTMLGLEAERFACSRKNYLGYLAAARLDEDEAVVADEAAQAEFAGELTEAFDQPLHAHADKIARLRAIDFAPTSRVAEGAVVKFMKRWFVVAVATDRFECDGHMFMGISTEAPLYQAMEGQSAGDSFTFRGRTVTLEEVF